MSRLAPQCILNRHVLLLTCAALSWSLCTATHSAEPLTDKQIDALIEGLASPNNEPSGMNPGLADEPQNYDSTPQLAIRDRLGTLTRAGERAIPHLIEHLDDDRYCVTVKDETGFYNRSIGFMCERILRSHIDVPIQTFNRIVIHQGGDGRGSMPSYINHLYLQRVLGDKEQWGKWWKENAKRGLAQVQLDAVVWSIEVERKRGFASIMEEAKVLAPLEWLRKSIETTGKPLPPSEQSIVEVVVEAPVQKEEVEPRNPGPPGTPAGPPGAAPGAGPAAAPAPANPEGPVVAPTLPLTVAQYQSAESLTSKE